MTRALTATGAPLTAAPATASQTLAPISREACDLFYRNTAPALRAYLRRMTGADPDDLLQDAYVRLLSAPRSELTEPRAYLYRIATRLVLDRWKRDKLHRGYLAHAAHTAPSFTAPDAPTSDFEASYNQLPPRDRMILWLAHVEGLDHREVAAAVNCGPASVRVLLFRARRKLESILRKNGWNPA